MWKSKPHPLNCVTGLLWSKQPFHLRLFYFFAYRNLILVFVITFVIALWRWW